MVVTLFAEPVTMSNDPEHAQFAPPALHFSPQPQTPVQPAPSEGASAPINHVPTSPGGPVPTAPKTIRPMDTASVETAAGAVTGMPWGGPTGTQPKPTTAINAIPMVEAVRTGAAPMLTALGQSKHSTAGGSGPRTIRPGGKADNQMTAPQRANGEMLRPNVQIVGGHPGGFDPSAAEQKRGRASVPNTSHPGAPQPARAIAQTHDATDPYGSAQGVRTLAQASVQIHDPLNPHIPTGGAPRPATHAVTAKGVQVNNPLETMAAGGSGIAPGVQQAVINRGPQDTGAHTMSAQIQPQGMPQQPFTMPAMQGGPGMSPHGRGAAQPSPVQSGPPQFPGQRSPVMDGPVQPVQPMAANPTLQGPPVPPANPSMPQAMQSVTPTAPVPTQGEIATSEHGAAVMVTPEITPITLDTGDGTDGEGPVAPVQPTIQPAVQDAQPPAAPIYSQPPVIEQGPAAPQLPRTGAPQPRPQAYQPEMAPPPAPAASAAPPPPPSSIPQAGSAAPPPPMSAGTSAPQTSTGQHTTSTQNGGNGGSSGGAGRVPTRG